MNSGKAQAPAAYTGLGVENLRKTILPETRFVRLQIGHGLEVWALREMLAMVEAEWVRLGHLQLRGDGELRLYVTGLQFNHLLRHGVLAVDVADTSKPYVALAEPDEWGRS